MALRIRRQGFGRIESEADGEGTFFLPTPPLYTERTLRPAIQDKLVHLPAAEISPSHKDGEVV